MSRFDEIKQDIADGFPTTESDGKYLIGEIDRLRAELEARSIVSSDVNAEHARKLHDAEAFILSHALTIERQERTIAALLAIPDEWAAENRSLAAWRLRARMAAVLAEGEER